MSTPNPTHIDVVAGHQLRDWYPMTYRPVSKSWLCSCGYKDSVPMPCTSDDVKRAHAEHVVSKLMDAGYSIMPSDGIVRTYQAASTLGFRYMLPKHFGVDREEAERWFKLHQSALDGLPGVNTVRLEYRDEYVTGWLPLAAAAEGETP